VGREVVSQLPSGKDTTHIRALVRNPREASLPKHVEVVYGDLTLPGSLDDSLRGIETVFLVWTAPVEFAAAAIGRIAKNARRVVMLSAPLKTPHPFFQQPNPSRTRAEALDRLIEDSGLRCTFLRPGIFAANVLFWWADRIRAGAEVVRWPCADVPTAPIDERDIAAVAVCALCEEGHDGREYVMTGPESLSQGEQLTIVGEVLGRRLRMLEISPDEARHELTAILPAAIVNMLLDAWEAAAGQPAFLTSTVAAVTRAPPRTFREWVVHHAAEFRVGTQFR
jgi:uncharacterized protein YbjT (DUF2867 family)